jgi:hypothetical protein
MVAKILFGCVISIHASDSLSFSDFNFILYQKVTPTLYQLCGVQIILHNGINLDFKIV